MRTTPICLSLLIALLSSFIPLQAGDPWADQIVEYRAGSEISVDFVTNTAFDDPTVVLGEPTRYTSDPDNFGGATTPLQSSFRSNEVVSIGKGGSLTVAFDEPVRDDPKNPFGIDLLIFGNSFLFGANIFNPDFSFNPAGRFDGIASEGGIVELSDDGVNFTAVEDFEADGLFPTNGYNDLTEPFPFIEGNEPTNFTLPVDPTLEVVGKTYAEVLAGYAGSGGGAGIDIGAWGFNQITHVRISNPADAVGVPEVDAFADVSPLPEPSSWLLACLTMLIALGTRDDNRPGGWFNV